jgi:hypothetical protein
VIKLIPYLFLALGLYGGFQFVRTVSRGRFKAYFEEVRRVEQPVGYCVGTAIFLGLDFMGFVGFALTQTWMR